MSIKYTESKDGQIKGVTYTVHCATCLDFNPISGEETQGVTLVDGNAELTRKEATTIAIRHEKRMALEENGRDHLLEIQGWGPSEIADLDKQLGKFDNLMKEWERKNNWPFN